MICLLIILLIKVLTADLVANVSKQIGDYNLPQFIYVSDFPYITNMLSNHTLKDCKVIYSYGATSPELLTEFGGKGGMMESLPQSFKSDCYQMEYKEMPYFRESDYTSIDAMGEKIGKQLVELNKIPIDQVESSPMVGDGYIRNNFTQSAGDKNS